MGNTYEALLKGTNAQLLHNWRSECYDDAQAENRLEVLDANSPASKRKNSKPTTNLYFPI